jgi:hypothetical protein
MFKEAGEMNSVRSFLSGEIRVASKAVQRTFKDEPIQIGLAMTVGMSFITREKDSIFGDTLQLLI